MRRRVVEVSEALTHIVVHGAVGSDFTVARTGLDLVHLLGTDHPAAREAAAEARLVFERVGAQQYLDLLGATSAGIGSGIKARPAASRHVSAPRGARS